MEALPQVHRVQGDKDPRGRGETQQGGRKAWITALIQAGVALALKRTTGPAGRRISAPQLDRGKPGASFSS